MLWVVQLNIKIKIWAKPWQEYYVSELIVKCYTFVLIGHDLQILKNYN